MSESKCGSCNGSGMEASGKDCKDCAGTGKVDWAGRGYQKNK